MKLALALLVVSCSVAGGIAGCGGSDTPATNDTAKFIGTWNYSGGMNVTTCPGLGPISRADTGTLVITANGEELTAVSAGCTLKFMVSGNSAMLEANQSCMTTVMTFPTTIHFQTGTITTTDGHAMTQTGTANVMVATSSSSTINCTSTDNGMLTK